MTMDTSDCGADEVEYQARMGQNLTFKCSVIPHQTLNEY